MSKSKYTHLLNASTLHGLEALFWQVWVRSKRRVFSILINGVTSNISADVDIRRGVPRRSGHHPQKIRILGDVVRDRFIALHSSSLSRLSYSLGYPHSFMYQLLNIIADDVPAPIPAYLSCKGPCMVIAFMDGGRWGMCHRYSSGDAFR
jgi:hypothetical protein